MQPPQGMGQNMRFLYFTGSCQSSNDAQNEIKRNFLVILDKFLQHEGGCADPNNQLVCAANKVQIKCGKTQVVGGRRRRSAQVSIFVVFASTKRAIGMNLLPVSNLNKI